MKPDDRAVREPVRDPGPSGVAARASSQPDCAVRLDGRRWCGWWSGAGLRQRRHRSGESPGFEPCPDLLPYRVLVHSTSSVGASLAETDPLREFPESAGLSGPPLRRISASDSVICRIGRQAPASTVWDQRPPDETPAYPRSLTPLTKSASRQDLLFIVSRDAVDHYVHLKGAFADNKRVTIILDRRRGERRKASSAQAAGRHQADRRSRPLIDDRVRRQGWAIVWIPMNAPKRTPSRDG